MTFDSLFTVYNSIEPPEIIKDNIDLEIPDTRQTNFTQYPMVTAIDSSTTDLQDYPGVISPFDVQENFIKDTAENVAHDSVTPVIETPKQEVIEKPKVTKKVSKPTKTGKFNDRQDFVTTLNSAYREALLEHGLDPNYSYILTASAALESAWGSKVSGTFNYGGVKGKTGSVKSTIDYVNGQYIRRNQTFRDFSSVKDYCNYVIKLLSNKRYNAFNTHSASHPFQFWRHVLDAGYGGGDTAGKNSYMDSVSKIYSMVKTSQNEKD